MRKSLSSSLSLLPILAIATASLACGASKDVGSSDLDPKDGGSGFDARLEGGLDPDGGIPFQEIDLIPGNATIYIDTATSPATPATVTYKAILNNADKTTKDVTSTIKLSVDDSALGTFSGATFTSVNALPGKALGVTTIVRGLADGKTGTANLTIVQLRKTGDKRDFYFVEPYGGSPSPDRDVLKFGTNIKSVDVAVLMDTTGSMSGSVENLKTNLSATVFPALAKAIPSVGLSVSYHDDYPLDPYGTADCSFGGTGLPGDVPVGVIQVITTDLAKAQAGANKLEVHCGNDGPESQIPGQYHILTGNELKWSGGSVAKHTPPAGTFGGVDFRPGSLPVVALITDVEWHDVAGSDPYGSDIISPPSLEDLKKAYVAANARFVDITDSYAPEDQANALSDATKSHIPAAAFGACPTAGTGPCCTDVAGKGRPADGPGGDCRLNFRHSGGTGVSTSIVKAIQAISVGSQFDVTAVASNDPTNADGVDATKFIKALRAMDEGDASQGCPAHAAKDTNGDSVKDTFIAVVVGTPVCFEVLPERNTTVPPKSSAQFFNAFIDVLGMPGSVKLDRRTVLFLVPPKAITAF
jgi:hypothetical protein